MKNSLLFRKLESIKNEYELEDIESSFYYLNILLFTNFNEFNDIDDIETYITDTKFNGREADKGIDIFYVDEVNREIHLFNCKYSNNNLNKTFPSNETSKIIDFINMLSCNDEKLISGLSMKMQELITRAYNIMNGPDEYCLVIHLCSNFINKMIKKDLEEFSHKLESYIGVLFDVQEHILDDYIELIKTNNYKKANAQFSMTDNKYFEKSDGDVRALIVSIKAFEILRMIVDNKEYRENPQQECTSDVLTPGILEDIFYDNVRQYKGNKNKINKTIVDTAKSDNANMFFYYNNGITITCSKFKYNKGVSNPYVSLENIQIVNGSQTLHALYEVAIENINKLDKIELLCRIYEINNEEASTKIAEYTNSQSPVMVRDLKALDNIQIGLDIEARELGYFYERKKDMYKNEAKDRRIDAEKAGQALLAFYNKNPQDAKNNKNKIFSIHYDNIFNEDINFSKVLLCYKLYQYIDDIKRKIGKDIKKNDELYNEHIHILYSTYYFLYIMRILADKNQININSEDSYSEILKFYNKAQEIIYKAVLEEKKNEKKYTTADFFKSTKVKIKIDNILKELDIL